MSPDAPVGPGRSGAAPRRGVALFTAVTSMVAVVLLVAGLFTVVDLQFTAERNRSDAARASMLAEAALAHGVTLMETTLKSTDFNTLLAAGGMTAIPAAGVALPGGKYFLSVKDDPADPTPNDATDSNQRITLVCTGRTHGGSEVTINYVVGKTGTFQGAMAVGGPMEISGKPQFTGSCGAVHANGALTGGGEPKAVQGWSTSSGLAIPSKFTGNPRATGVPEAVIPVIDPATKCPAGATTLGAEVEASTLASNRTYCRTGNLELKGDLGSPRTISIVVTGSIKIDGKPRFKAHHPEGFVILAGGDIDMSSEADLEGLVYCGGRIKISSAAKISGVVLCRNATHTGAPWADKNLISGDASFNAVCSKIPTLGGDVIRQVAQYDSIVR